jgi:hypothetical protein
LTFKTSLEAAASIEKTGSISALKFHSRLVHSPATSLLPGEAGDFSNLVLWSISMDTVIPVGTE